MTLTAAFRCMDGFVIAADTEITLRAVRVQGHKLLISRLDEPYTMCIAFSGDVGYALAAGQQIFATVRGITPTLANIRQAIATTLAEFYEQHMRHNWVAIGAQPPLFDLMIGFQGQEQRDGFSVIATSNDVIYDVEGAAFSGSGYDTASYVAERLLSGGSYSTAVTHHLAQQLFREVKRERPVRWRQHRDHEQTLPSECCAFLYFALSSEGDETILGPRGHSLERHPQRAEDQLQGAARAYRRSIARKATEAAAATDCEPFQRLS